MRFVAALLAVLVAVASAPGQDTPPIDEQLVQKALARITPGATLKKVAKLAGDEFEGRNAGYAGCRKAGDWIGEQFKAAGLRPAGFPATIASMEAGRQR